MPVYCPPPIKEAFFADQGLGLQYRDSQMAEQVMPTFTKAEKPILFVPDSFLVLLDDEELLLKGMQEAYKSVFGKDVKVDTKTPKFVIKPPPEFIDIDEVLKYSSGFLKMKLLMISKTGGLGLFLLCKPSLVTIPPLGVFSLNDFIESW